MSMSITTEKRHAGFFIISEGPVTLSREPIIVASGEGVLPAGQALGKLTSGGKYVAYDNAASDGSQTCVAVLYGEVDATSADAEGVGLDCMAEVDGDVLTGIDAAGIVDLAARFIKVR